MKKKITALVLSLMLVISLAGCGYNKPDTDNSTETSSVVDYTINNNEIAEEKDEASK